MKVLCLQRLCCLHDDCEPTQSPICAGSQNLSPRLWKAAENSLKSVTWSIYNHYCLCWLYCGALWWPYNDTATATCWWKSKTYIFSFHHVIWNISGLLLQFWILQSLWNILIFFRVFYYFLIIILKHILSSKMLETFEFKCIESIKCYLFIP